MDVTATGRGLAGIVLLGGLVALSGCGGSGGGSGAGAPSVTVQVGDQRVTVDPTQYCLDGHGQRYDTSPPIVEAVPDSSITLTVPDAVAQPGWSIQVFDEKLEERIGEVKVDPGTAVYDGITTSDIAPPTFYLVVVENSDPGSCSGLSGAWPVGFIRDQTPSGTSGPAAPTTAPAPVGG